MYAMCTCYKEHSSLFEFWLWRVSLEVWCHHDGYNYDSIIQRKKINVVYVVYLKKKTRYKCLRQNNIGLFTKLHCVKVWSAKKSIHGGKVHFIVKKKNK